MPFWKCFSCLKFPTDECITELDYSNSTLTNVPPDVSQFERTLEELYLSSNRISDLPPELFYCQGLRVLKLNDNELEQIPVAIGSFRQLQTLDLSRNALSDIPDNIKWCRNLTHLDLSLNNLQRLPDAITNLITLQELLLNETYLEFLPANFGRLVNLRILELRSNYLVTLPKSMARLTELTRIDIGANEFSELPEVIGSLTKLRELWVDCNRITRIPANIANLRELVHFEANQNMLKHFPAEISNWRNLEVLSLSSNDLESLPFSLGMLKRLVILKCDSNQLKDLPDSICQLEQLEELVINHNFIMRLPGTIGLLRKLRYLIADENLLRRVPNEISSCMQLSVLSVRSNQLTELPHDIGHLKNLRVINVVDNMISTLPVSMLNLTNLSALWISDNQSQPIVPLQYADNATKTQLTCFMLPQRPTTSHDADEQHTMMMNGDDGGGQLQDGVQHHTDWYQEIPANSGNQMRRICFADETTNKTNELITTRLLRSPTPYPKELRQMAKFAARNGGQTGQTVVTFQGVPSPGSEKPPESDHSPESLPPASNNHHIKEAKVLHNSQLISNQQDAHHRYMQPNNGYDIDPHSPSPAMPQSASSLAPSCDNLTDVQIYLGEAGPTAIMTTESSHYDNRSMIAPMIATSDFVDGMGQRHRHHHLLQLQDNPNYGNYYESLNIMTDPNHLYGTTAMDKMSHSSMSWRQAQTPTPSSSSIQQDFTNHHSHYFSPNEQQQQQSQTNIDYYPGPMQYGTSNSDRSPPSFYGHQPQHRPVEPPPYHIAKAYTKKSRQDLLTYDSVRNRNQSASSEFLDDTKNSLYNAGNSPGQRFSREMATATPTSAMSDYNSGGDAASIISKNNNNDTNSVENVDNFISNSNGIETMENNNNGLVDDQGNNKPLAYNANTNDSYGAQELHINDTALSSTSDMRSESRNGMSDNDMGNGTQHAIQMSSPNGRSKSAQWLFGLHRNPTVKQVMLRKDPTLGFDIKEVANRGIFVSTTVPMTHANELLRIDDKILDVDGIDFSKVTQHQARQILHNCGPIVNIMISRT